MVSEQQLLRFVKGDALPFLFLIFKKKARRLITKKDDITNFMEEKQIALKQTIWKEI